MLLLLLKLLLLRNNHHKNIKQQQNKSKSYTRLYNNNYSFIGCFLLLFIFFIIFFLYIIFPHPTKNIWDVDAWWNNVEDCINLRVCVYFMCRKKMDQNIFVVCLICEYCEYFLFYQTYIHCSINNYVCVSHNCAPTYRSLARRLQK